MKTIQYANSQRSLDPASLASWREAQIAEAEAFRPSERRAEELRAAEAFIARRQPVHSSAPRRD